MTVCETINQIDRQIDAVTAQLRGVERIRSHSAASWQHAWDRHPDLEAQFRDLYRQRGEAQRVRDSLEAKPRRRRILVTLSGRQSTAA